MPNPLRILLIEDSESDANLILRELHRIGYEVEYERVETAEAMQAILTEKVWDLVLSDYTLPKFNAVQALILLKAQHIDLPFIIISSPIGEETAVSALKAGANDYLIKGKLARLGSVIERELREVETRRERRKAQDLADRVGLASSNARLFNQVQGELSERKEAEQALRESQTRLSGIIESAMDAIITIDEEQRITLFNPAAEQIFHWSAAEVIGSPLDRLLPERFRSVHRQHVHNFGETGIARRTMGALGVLRGLRANGEEFPIEASISHLEAAGRKFYTVILRDISERKRAEEAVLESEQKYSVIFDKSPFAITLSKMPEVTIVGVNDAFLDLFEFTQAEVIGKTSVELGIADAESLAQVAAELQACGRVHDFEVTRFTKAGERLDFALNLDRVTIGDETYILTTIRNITERKQAEEALRAKNEELKSMTQQLWQAAKLATMGELAASIAHELNNPLATISLRTEMLMTQFSSEDPQSKSLQIIDSEIKRMSSLVANLLQFSRRSTSQLSTIKVNDELANTLELIQYHLRKNAIVTVQKYYPETLLIQADRQQLRQVFLNLFTNAADAMPLGGVLTIRTWHGDKPGPGITAPLRPSANGTLGLPVSDKTQVFIEVTDTGEGIPADRLERVWEPFYTTKLEGKGTGLGLAICRRIIQEHGGTIEVISDGIPGKGTTVRLTLPGLRER
jgi:PAS domain S-box-containing protein